MKVSKVLLQGLNDLLTRNRDAQKGYVEASNHINHPALSKWMLDNSLRRQLFSAELDLEMRRLGGKPVDSTSVAGEAHRVWIDLKGFLTDNDTYAMLEECERGEEKSLEDYDRLLDGQEDMPKDTRVLLNRHKSKIITALSAVKTMMKMHVPAEY